MSLLRPSLKTAWRLSVPLCFTLNKLGRRIHCQRPLSLSAFAYLHHLPSFFQCFFPPLVLLSVTSLALQLLWVYFTVQQIQSQLSHLNLVLVLNLHQSKKHTNTTLACLDTRCQVMVSVQGYTLIQPHLSLKRLAFERKGTGEIIKV